MLRGAEVVAQPMSSYNNQLGVIRSCEGLTKVAKQGAQIFHQYPKFEAAERACKVIAAPDEILTEGKNFLTWFEFFVRFKTLSQLRDATWQKRVSRIAQIFQKALETFVILPTKWGFIAIWEGLENYKFAKEIFSGLASLFGAIAYQQEIPHLDRKIAKWEQIEAARATHNSAATRLEKNVEQYAWEFAAYKLHNFRLAKDAALRARDFNWAKVSALPVAICDHFGFKGYLGVELLRLFSGLAITAFGFRRSLGMYQGRPKTAPTLILAEDEPS